MKNKAFIVIFSALLLFGLISPPIAKILADNGVIKFEDLANYQDPVQVGEGPLQGVLQGIENAKADIANIYINYLPFYGDIIDRLSKTKSELNKSSNSSLTNWGVELLAKNKVEQTEPAQTEPAQTGATAEPSPTESTSNITAPPVTTPAAVMNPNPFIYGGKLESEFLFHKSIYNNYALYATLEDGETVKFLERVIVMDDETAKARADKSAAELNRLAAADPNINYYVYYGTRLQGTEHSEECYPDALDCIGMMDYFENGLSEDIAVSRFKIGNIENRLNTYYLSDHHWSADGMLQAYREIIDLIQTKTPNIEDAREPVDYFCDENTRFYGMYARDFSVRDVWDKISFYDFDLPYHTQIGGVPVAEMQEKFRRGEVESGYDLYALLYQQAYLYTYPENNTGRNLMIIGDSFMRCIAETVASHFDTTFVWHVVYGSEFDYAEYMERYNITDVLVVCMDIRIIYDCSDDLHFERIVTD